MAGRHFDTFEKYYASLLEWRNIESPCKYCAGSGWKTYGSTAVWRGGIGGQSMTNAVCNSCWGSGDANRSWVNLKEIDEHIKTQIDKGLENVLERRLGAEYYTKELFEQLCVVLEKETRKRTVGHDYKFMVRRLINIFNKLGK